MSKQEPRTPSHPPRLELEAIAIRFDADQMAEIARLSKTDEMLPEKHPNRPCRAGKYKPSFSRTVRVLVDEALAVRAEEAATYNSLTNNGTIPLLRRHNTTENDDASDAT